MKEMVYTFMMRDAEVLHEDIYENYKFYIVSYGTHPCCYVEIDPASSLWGKDADDIPLDCHGGITFAGRKDFAGFAFCIGWDYAHSGDRYGHFIEKDDHEWTTEELLEECKAVIDQLPELELRTED